MAHVADKSERLLRQAEYEMRRSFPDADGRPAKRARQEGEPEVEEVGRFDYSAVQELSTGAATGFLLTCDFRREKSATKEASKLLNTYLQRRLPQQPSPGAGSSMSGNGAAAAGHSVAGEDGAAAGEAGSEAAGSAAAPSRPLLSIIKLGCKGLVMLKLSGEAAAALTQQQQQQQRPAPAAQLVQAAASELLADVDSGKVKRLEFCQRAIPFHTTCRLELQALQGAAARVAALVADAENAEAPGTGGDAKRPAGGEGEEGTGAAAHHSISITFGVGYKQRLSAEGGAKTAPIPAAAAVDGSSNHQEAAPAGGGGAAAEGVAVDAASAAAEGAASLGRMEVIHAVAGAFERTLQEEHGIQSKVDLKAPSWVVLVEELPVAGVSYVALSALPAAMCAVKPRLGVRPVGKAKPS